MLALSHYYIQFLFIEEISDYMWKEKKRALEPSEETKLKSFIIHSTLYPINLHCEEEE